MIENATYIAPELTMCDVMVESGYSGSGGIAPGTGGGTLSYEGHEEE